MENRIELIKQYLKLLANFKKPILTLFLLSTLSVILQAPLPLIYSQIVDQALPNKDLSELSILICLLIGAITLSSGLGFWINVSGSKIKQKFRSTLRTQLYTQVQSLPYERLSSFMSGDLTSRLTQDLDSIERLLPLELAKQFKHLLMALSVIGVLFYLNWKLTLISGCMIPLFFLLFMSMQGSLWRLSKQSHDKRGEMQASIQEKVEGVRDIRLTDTLNQHEAVVQKVIEESEVSYSELAIQESKFELGMGFFQIIGSLILWGIGGFWVIKGQMSVGQIIGVSYAFGIAFMPISALFTFFSGLSYEAAALRRLFQLFSLSSDSTKQPDTGLILTHIKGRIEFKDLSFGYKPSDKILDSINLTFLPGTLTAIVGESGIGKTTFLFLASRMYTPNSGNIYLDGIDIQQISSQSLRKTMGFVPQNVFLFRGSIKDNILMGRTVPDSQFEKACRLSGVTELSQKFSTGIETMLLEKGQNLSGGQKQKIAIARALLEDPQILLLDEPTTNLDADAKTRIQQGLLLAKEGKTIILVTHDDSLLPEINQIYELKNKKITLRKIR